MSSRARSVGYPADWRPRFADAYRIELQAWIDAVGAGSQVAAGVRARRAGRQCRRGGRHRVHARGGRRRRCAVERPHRHLNRPEYRTQGVRRRCPRFPPRCRPPAPPTRWTPRRCAGASSVRAGSPSGSSDRCSGTPGSRCWPSASRDLGRSTAFARQARRRPGVRVVPGAARRPGRRRRLHRDPAQRALPVRAAVAAGRQAHPGGEADRVERRPGRPSWPTWPPRRACSSPRRSGRCSCRSST